MTDGQLDVWQQQLAELIAKVLIEHLDAIDDDLLFLAIDCHPWNGVIALAILTQSEYATDPKLGEVSEMASWRNYDFASKGLDGQSILELARQMRVHYDKSSPDRNASADAFFRRCAAAALMKPVKDALSAYSLSDSFRITVTHPDTDEEYFPIG